MRKILALIVLLVGLVYHDASAQLTVLITGDEQRSAYEGKNYLVVKSLRLMPGFTFTATTTTSFIAKGHPAAVPPSSPSPDKNYVMSESILVPGITTESQVKGLSSVSKSTSYTYSDGFGRQIQSIAVDGSTSQDDIITPFVYDALGRPDGNYLSYSESSGNAGSYRSNAVTSQEEFFDSPPSKVQDDQRAHDKINYDNSPFGRIVSTAPVGDAWTTKTTTSSVKLSAYGIPRWSVSTNGLPDGTGVHQVNELLISETTNAEGLISRTYTSGIGRTILEEVQTTGNRWAKTYYVYNDFNQLRFIIPPKVAETSNPLAPDTVVVNHLCYQYEYDDLQRQIATKNPGADWVYTIYDQWDRPVLTQDGNQRRKSTPEWSFVKYDDLGRAIMTGVYATATSRNDLTNTLSTFAGQFEKRNNTAIGYTVNTAFPTGTPEADLRTITYYDNYHFLSASGWDAEGNSYSFVPESGYTGTLAASTFNLVTGSKVKILNSSVWLNDVVRYDTYFRALQTISENQFGKTDRQTTDYDHSGNILKSKYAHTNALPQTITIQQRYTYDANGRIVNHYHQINTQPEVLLSSLEYNELGQVVDKKLHSISGSPFLQSVDYRYNIQGSNTNINYTSPDSGDPADYFNLQLGYNTKASGATGRFDGLLSSSKWKHDVSSKDRVYDYTYDKASLTAATYRVDNTPNTQPNVYNESGLTYDLNGNITALNRYTGGLTAIQIDQLAYDYGTKKGNRLMKVTEGLSSGAATQGFNDGNTSGDDYTYDANGNLNRDRNKGIKAGTDDPGIIYNILDLPERINFSNGDYILYTYDAIGTKLSQTFMTSGGSELAKLIYSGDFVYEGTTPQMILHSEGRLVTSSNANLIANTAVREAASTSGFTASPNVTPSTYTNGSPLQNYVKVLAGQAGTNVGITSIGGDIPVTAGANYTFKVLGYQGVGTTANLYVSWTTGSLLIPGSLLKIGSVNEDWTTGSFTVPAGVTQIKLGVVWTSASVNDAFYINKVALYQTEWEYQYFLTDQQNSPRVVLQTTPTTTTYTATMEPSNYSSENERFLNLNSGREFSAVPAANATVGGAYYYVLNSANRVGPGRSFKVLPGDVINADVMAYYPAGGTYSKTAVGTMASAVATALSAGYAGAIDAVVSTSYTNPGGLATLALSADQGTTRPSAFLNFILFDETYTPIEAKSAPVGATGGVLHQVSLPAINVAQTGYLYVYLSYDNNAGGNDVYFDELNISYQESPVIQINSYYPFGLPSFSWTRTGEYENKYLYQGKELNSKTGWQDFGSRFYSAETGRWFGVDPKGQFASPYMAMGNVPMMGVDPNGEFWHIVIGAAVGGIINVALHWDRIMTGGNPWKDGLVAFGIGAVAGGVTAATGGAAFLAAGGTALGGGGFVAGAVGSAFGTGFGSIIESMGNALYFQDPLITMGQLAQNALTGGLTGGLFNGVNALKNGLTFWKGLARPGIPLTPVIQSPNFGPPEVETTYEDDLANRPKMLPPGPASPKMLPSGPPDPRMLNAAKGIIKEFPAGELAGREMQSRHIWSEGHINSDITKALGKQTPSNYDKVVKIVIDVDNAGLLMIGDNDIRTVINNIPVTIRVHIFPNGTVGSLNAFTGQSKRIVQNLIHWTNTRN